MSHNPVRPWRNIDRRESRQIMVGNVPVGGGAPISVQTMTNTDTSDVAAPNQMLYGIVLLFENIVVESSEIEEAYFDSRLRYLEL